MFYLSKTNVFENPHFLSQIVFKLKNDSIMAPKWTPNRLKKHPKYQPETCQENVSIFDLKMTPN